MVRLMVENKMWQILLFSICLTNSKFFVAADLQYGQDVTGQLKYSPYLRPPLSNSPSFLNQPHLNDGGNSVQEPLPYHQELHHLDGSQTSPGICPHTGTLQNILVLLKSLLKQDNSYAIQFDKWMQIFQAFKEFFEKPDAHVIRVNNEIKLRELLDSASKAMLVQNEAYHEKVRNENQKNHIEAQFVFKYDIPDINNLACKEALDKLIQIVKNIHAQMINYCNQLGQCSYRADSSLLGAQPIDQSNVLNNIDHQNRPLPIQTQKTPLNQNDLNVYDFLNYIQNLVNTQNQMLSQQRSNDYLKNPYKIPESFINVPQHLATGNLNTGIVHSSNNQETSKDYFNYIYLNNQQNDKSNIIDSLFNFNDPMHKQVPIKPSSRDPMNNNNLVMPSNNLVTPLLQGLTQTGSQLSTNSFNKEVVQSNVLNKQQINIDTSHNQFLNMLKSNGKHFYDINRNIPTNGIKGFSDINNPLVQSPIVERDFMNFKNDLNSHKFYEEWLQRSRHLNDKNSYLAMINQNKQNTQHNGTSVLFPQNNIISQIPITDPSFINNFKTGNLIDNLANFQNNIKPLQNLKFDTLNVLQNPYLSSLNLNHQNSLNYYSQHSNNDVIQSNLGLDSYASTVLANYPEHNIHNGNRLVDFGRLVTISNLGKLNSADKEGVVELTYKLKRPQFINYNPYYYYVKYRMPYKNFVSKVIDLSRNPNLLSDPQKINKELLSISSLAETSPDLQNIERNEVSKLILNNGATLVNAKVLDITDSNAVQNLKMIQNLNANLKTTEILGTVDKDNKYNTDTSLDSASPIFRPDPNTYNKESYLQNLESQYMHNNEPRRWFVPQVQYDTKTVPIPFVSVNLPPEIALSSENQGAINQVLDQTLRD